MTDGAAETSQEVDMMKQLAACRSEAFMLTGNVPDAHGNSEAML